MSVPVQVTLKLAGSLDGRIAAADGSSRWITGPEAREAVHHLRAEHDAVMVGIGTALADDPELTVRLDGFSGRQPIRVVVDTAARLPVSSKLAQTARVTPTWVLTVTEAASNLSSLGVEIIKCPSADGKVDICGALDHLAARGVAKLFVEGGGVLASAFLNEGLVHRIEWFAAPLFLGAAGQPAVGVLAESSLGAAPRFRMSDMRRVGPDAWMRLERE